MDYAAFLVIQVIQTQAKILRILQEQKFERVGGTRTLTVDVRVIAASNKDLEREIEKGTFREDLYYRLNVIPIEVPPLRNRSEDIPFLVEHFIHKSNKTIILATHYLAEAETVADKIIILNKGLIVYDQEKDLKQKETLSLENIYSNLIKEADEEIS